MSSLEIALLAGVPAVFVLPLASSQTRVSYPCQPYKVRYTERCGWWSRCTKYRTQTRTCYKIRPVNGGWTGFGTWSAYSTCTRSCGGGTQVRTRSRSCTNPRPAYGGKNCVGSTIGTQSRSCNTQKCTIHGGWSKYGWWSTFTPCTVSCGGGTQTQTRTRSCTSPSPMYGGRQCVGTATDTNSRACNTHHCPIHGGWSKYGWWSTFTPCTVSCGGGTQTQTRTRSCTSPSPMYGGRQCVGTATDTNSRACNTHHCPIHGGWSQYGWWSTFTPCTVSCGGGTQTQTRTRSCTSPSPMYGGRQCVGTATDTNSRACNTHHCPIDGGWSEFAAWSPYTSCSVSCGGGNQTRTHDRTCTNPAPAYGGKQCQGDVSESEERECNTHHCPIDGGWSDYAAWSEYSTCTLTCGGGTQFRTRTRTCSSPAPQYGGQDCDGDATDRDERNCNTHHCPIDGGWTDWGEWQDMDDCTVLCGGGGKKDQERSRTCTNPAPAYGGADCEGENYQNQTVTCGEEDCGDQCPEGEVNYLIHTTNNKRFYQCSNGVAHRHDCADGTVFDGEAEVPGCKHAAIPPAPQPTDTCPEPFAMVADTGDCTKYIRCVHGTPHYMDCPPGTMFDSQMKVCVHGEC